MTKSKFLIRLSASIFAVVFAASCSAAPSGTPAQTTGRKPEASAAGTGLIRMLTATPAGGQATLNPAASITPRPTATLAPTTTPLPVLPLSEDDYFIIDSNMWDAYDERGPRGVVDANGRVVVPFAYQSIDQMVLTDRRKPHKKVQYFFAAQYMSVGGEIVESGCFYGTDGKIAGDSRFAWAVQYGDDRIAVQRADDMLCGVLASDFSVVVPFKYTNIVCFDDWLAAMRKRGKSFWIDFYDKDCKLKTTMKVGSADIFGANSEVLVATGTNGKIGFIDGSMTWCAKPQWDEYEGYDYDTDGIYLGPGYAVSDNDNMYHVNKYGKDFTPEGCDPEGCTPAGAYMGHSLYQNASVLFNDEGKVLYRSDKDFTFTDGVILEDGKVLDLNGKNLLPGVTDVLDWDPQTGYYECGTRTAAESYGWVDTITALYTKDGKKLQLPEGKEYQCISTDRIIVKTKDGKYGICNRQGKWILAPQSYVLDSTVWPYFVVKTGNANNTDNADSGEDSKCGLMDDNGHILFNPVFDDITLLSERRGFFEVFYNGVHGIIDTQGNWIWYSTNYSDLQD